MTVLAVVEIDETSNTPLELLKIYDEGDITYWDTFIAEAVENLRYKSKLTQVEEFNQLHLKALFELLIQQGILTTKGLVLEPIVMHSVEKHYARTKFRWSWHKKKQKQLEEKYRKASQMFSNRIKERLSTQLMLKLKTFLHKSPIIQRLISKIQQQ